jgi:hypothetical protein
MTFLKSLWRKLFPVKSFDSGVFYNRPRTLVDHTLDSFSEKIAQQMFRRKAYDPSQDENRILKGEVESYFE